MDIAPIPAGAGPHHGQQPGPQRQDAMMREARALEASFLAEMLGHAGLGAPSDSFGGGHGEEQFASFLKQEQARLMVERGGIGLAELIFKTMAGAEAKDAG